MTCNSTHADVKKESQPKLAWGEVKEEPPQSNGPQPQLRKESGQAMKVPQINKSLEEPKISSMYNNNIIIITAIHYCIGKKIMLWIINFILVQVQ